MKELNDDDLKKIEINLQDVEGVLEQLEKFEKIIPILGKFLDLINEKVNPIYELVEKFKITKEKVTSLQKIKEDKEKEGSYI